MKGFRFVLLIVSLISLSLHSCGPSEEEKAYKAYQADIKKKAAERKAYLDATQLVFQEGKEKLERSVADSSEAKKNIFVLTNEYYSRWQKMDIALKYRGLTVDEWRKVFSKEDAIQIHKETGRKLAPMFITIATMPQDKKSRVYMLNDPHLEFTDDALIIGKALYILRAIQITPEEIGYSTAKLEQMVLKYLKAQLAATRQLESDIKWPRMNLIIMEGEVNWKFTPQEMGVTKAEIDSLEALPRERE